ncbi:unnamed protein product [Pylaiella littoralis]
MSHVFGGGCRRHRYRRLEPASVDSPRSVLLRTGAVAIFFAAASIVSLLLSHHHDVDSAHQGGKTNIATDSSATDARSQLAVEASAAPLEGRLEVRLWNAYSNGGPDLQSSWHKQRQQLLNAYNLENLAEPYRPTVMQVAEPWHGELLRQGKTLRWEVDGVVVGVGFSLEITFETIGTLKCSATPFSADDAESELPRRVGGFKDVASGGGVGETDGSFTVEPREFEVTVRYVRREIRDLTDRDREIFFNAISVLQRVPSAVGREIYGDNYYSRDYFNRLHFYGGADHICDHLHDGTGFTTSHMALTMQFERAVQAVNPSIAVPYWDFTIEGTAFDWTDFRKSAFFSDDWFGSAAPRNKDRVPNQGRFGYIPVMTNASEYSRMSNSYGMLRAPWNTDPTPFITRSEELFGYRNNRKPSGCRQYRDSYAHNDWMSFAAALGTDAHGHIHEILGGAWSVGARSIASRTTDVVQPFLHVLQIMTKRLWRADFFTCPETCDSSEPPSSCRCSCNADDLAGKTSAQILQDAEITGSFFYDANLNLVPLESLTEDDYGNDTMAIPGYTAQESEEIFNVALRVMCTPAREGTSYEATSTNDPTFWVMHPTIDRLWHLKRINEVEGEFDHTWVHSKSVCYGHNPGDTQPFHDLFHTGDSKEEQPSPPRYTVKGSPAPARADDGREATRPRSSGGGGGGAAKSVDDGKRLPNKNLRASASRSLSRIDPPKTYYTNAELYDLLHPLGVIPYLYDNFDWPHCDAIGVHIS